MKKWFYQVILLSFICGLIVACSKDNDSDTPLYRMTLSSTMQVVKFLLLISVGAVIPSTLPKP